MQRLPREKEAKQKRENTQRAVAATFTYAHTPKATPPLKRTQQVTPRVGSHSQFR